MTEYKMLAEFVTYCGKCKLDLNHRITLMNGSVPARVLCLTCHGEHSYRDPSNKVQREAKRSVTPALKTRARQSSEQNDWNLLLSDQSVTPKKYNINEIFFLNDHVIHPKFELGLVVGFEHPDKVHIYFKDEGVKILKGKKG